MKRLSIFIYSILVVLCLSQCQSYSPGLYVGEAEHVSHVSDAASSRATPEPESLGALMMSPLLERLPVAVPESAFGAQAWQEYFGVDVGLEPPFTESALRVWNGEAPYLLEDETSRQCVKDNHLLTLIPGTVNGEEFTLDKLGDLLLANHGGHMTAFSGNTNQELGDQSHGFYYYSEYLTNATRHEPLPGAPYWLLLPKTVLADSRSKTFSDHKALVSQYSGTGYRLPGVLEVSASLLSHYARSKERLYPDDSSSTGLWTYTRCSDVDEAGCPLVVGGFRPAGLGVNLSIIDSNYFGVVGCWKF